MEYNINSDITADQGREFKADTASGLMLYGKTNICVKGDMQVLGKNVPIKFKEKRKLYPESCKIKTGSAFLLVIIKSDWLFCKPGISAALIVNANLTANRHWYYVCYLTP